MTNLLVFTDLAISVTSGKKLFCKRYKRKAAYVSHSPDKRHPTLFYHCMIHLVGGFMYITA